MTPYTQRHIDTTSPVHVQTQLKLHTLFENITQCTHINELQSFQTAAQTTKTELIMLLVPASD